MKPPMNADKRGLRFTTKARRVPELATDAVLSPVEGAHRDRRAIDLSFLRRQESRFLTTKSTKNHEG